MNQNDEPRWLHDMWIDSNLAWDAYFQAIHRDKCTLGECQNLLFKAESTQAAYNDHCRRWKEDHSYNPFATEAPEFPMGEFPTGRELQTNWSEVQEGLW